MPPAPAVLDSVAVQSEPAGSSVKVTVSPLEKLAVIGFSEL